MCRRNKVDIVTAACLQLEHHAGEPLVRYFILYLFFVGLRNLIVLTINTAQIAVAEENVSRPTTPRERWLFAEMRRVRRDDRQSSGVAPREFILESVVAAIERTNCALFQQRFQRFNTAFQLA